MLHLYFLNCSVFFGLGSRHLRMNLSSGRIVVTKFPSTGYKMLFLSFITLTKGGKKERREREKINKEESESKEETGRDREGKRKVKEEKGMT